MRATLLVVPLFACGPSTPPPETQNARTAAPEEECDPEPSRSKVTATFEGVADEVKACAPSRTKVVRIAATFSSDGSVQSAEVLGPSGEPRRYPSQGVVMNLADAEPEHDGSIAGTPAADCMVEAVKGTRTHSFCDVQLLAIYPFRP